MKIFLFLFVFLSFSCGKSPFMNESSEKQKESASTEFEGVLVTGRSTRVEQNEKMQYKLRLLWEVGPDQNGENKLVLLVNDLNGKRVSFSKDFNAYIWMPSMGHGSSPISIHEVSEGIYELSDIYFIMGGHWEFYIQLKENQQIFGELKWPINL